MGLTEKRAIEDFKSNQYNDWKSKIETASGFQPEIQIEWDALATEGESHLFIEGFGKVYFEPLILAFKEITRDQMGSDALKKGLQKIHICNSSSFYSPNQAISFSSGVLKIDHSPTANIQDIKSRQQKIQEVLEKNI